MRCVWCKIWDLDFFKAMYKSHTSHLLHYETRKTFFEYKNIARHSINSFEKYHLYTLQHICIIWCCYIPINKVLQISFQGSSFRHRWQTWMKEIYYSGKVPQNKCIKFSLHCHQPCFKYNMITSIDSYQNDWLNYPNTIFDIIRKIVEIWFDNDIFEFHELRKFFFANSMKYET